PSSLDHSLSPNKTDSSISGAFSFCSSMISATINSASSSVTPNIILMARFLDCNSACTKRICLSISAPLSSAIESSNETDTFTSLLVLYNSYKSDTIKITSTSSINALSMITSCDCLDLNVLDCSDMTSVAVFID